MLSNAFGQFLIDNWTWLLGVLLTGLVTYWWWDERSEAESAGETVDRVTDRAESATGGALGGFRSLVIGVLGIVGTVIVEMMQFAGELNQLLGGIPFIIGYFLYGVISWAGISLNLEPHTLGFAFVLLFFMAAIVRFSNGMEESG